MLLNEKCFIAACMPCRLGGNSSPSPPAPCSGPGLFAHPGPRSPLITGAGPLAWLTPADPSCLRSHVTLISFPLLYFYCTPLSGFLRKCIWGMCQTSPGRSPVLTLPTAALRGWSRYTAPSPAEGTGTEAGEAVSHQAAFHPEPRPLTFTSWHLQ